LFPHLTASENIGYGLHSKPKGEREQSIAEIMASFHISHAKDRRPRAMSGGERQRVALARSLVTDPRALLLDEPMSALDYETKSRILRDLREWHTRHRIPIIYVTHALDEVFAIADQVLQMADGKMIAEGAPTEILGAQRDALIKGLQAHAQK
jgi:ABC-type Fe3+/spermidine/putrescine transport system ATPase subunit